MTQGNRQNGELIAAVQGGENVETLRKMARALAPREPEKQVAALVYLQVDIAPQRVELKAELAAIQKDAARVKGKLAELDKVESWADETILATMLERKIKTVDMGHATITFMPGKESVVVTDLDAIEDQYATYKKQANKREVARCLKETGVVPTGFDIVIGDPYITKRGKV